MKITRREFVKTTAIGAAGILAFKANLRHAFSYYNSSGLELFKTSLRGIDVIPVAAPDGSRFWQYGSVSSVKPRSSNYLEAAHYTIEINQFADNLHPALGNTPLWGYHPRNVLQGNLPQRHLGGIIVGRKGSPIQITFRNNLPATHILPVDPTIMGADQAQNRTAVHLHGGLVPWISDGGPHDWWAPDGTHGLSFLNNLVLNPGAAANEADYYYPNDQSARMVWYHDHAWGITRLNAYAGVATALIIRDSFEDRLKTVGLPDYIENGGREIPLVVQDKIFVDPATIALIDPIWSGPTSKGALWYPHTYDPTLYELAPGFPLPPDPSIIPEMFGDTMLVNGTVFPRVALEPRRYRLRVLNACQARFLNLQLYVDDGSPNGITLDPVTQNPINKVGPDFLVLGTEGGFLPKPVLVPSGIPFDPATQRGSLLTGLAERWDLLVDFKGFEGKKLILYNDAPAPFPFGDPLVDFFPGLNVAGNPVNGQTTPGNGPNTRVLMRFEVASSITLPADAPLGFGPGTDFIKLAQDWGKVWNDPLLAPAGGSTSIPKGVPVRRLTLNEAIDSYGRLIQLVGTNVAPIPGGEYGREYMSEPTEVVGDEETEVWEIANLSGDTHPMHFHLVNVQILNREPFLEGSYTGGTFASSGPPVLPDPQELGWKETVRMNPFTVTRVIMKFALPTVPFDVPVSPRTGAHEYVWHCHILEHEEHDMMRPLIVLDTLEVEPSLQTLFVSKGGSVTFKVKNAVLPITVTQSIDPIYSTYRLTVDRVNGRFTVTLPRNASGISRSGMKVTFTVKDASTRAADRKTATADLVISAK